MPSLYNVHTVPFYWGSAAEQSVNFFVPYASSSSCTSVHRAALYRYWWIFVILKNPLILRESWDCVIPVNPSWSCIMWFIFNFIKHNLLKDKRTYRATGKSLVFFYIYTKVQYAFLSSVFLWRLFMWWFFSLNASWSLDGSIINYRAFLAPLSLSSPPPL